MSEKFNVGFAAAGVGIAHHFSGGVYIKETRIPAGLKLSQHRHTYDHMGILVSGDVAIKHLEGVTEYLRGFCVVNIPAGREHEVTAVTDVVWLCVHATAETDPEKIDYELVE